MLHLVAGALFFLLSPGVLLTIPAGSRGLLFSGQTSMLAAAVHAVVFIAVTYLLTSAVEGFRGDPCNKQRDGSGCGTDRICKMGVCIQSKNQCTGRNNRTICYKDGKKTNCFNGVCGKP